MPRAMLTCLLLSATACGPGTPPPAASVVQHFGVMREVMKEGKVEPRVALARFQHKGCYGVGALAGLAGEVLIDDGVVFLARERATSVVAGAGDGQATLLTVAEVARWRELPLTAGTDLDGIERAIAADCESTGAVTPLPFLVIATSADLEMHVARGVCPHGATDPEHQPDVWHTTPGGTTSLRLVGFYAPGQAGVMTHHGTGLHAHAITTTRAAGHVDRLVVAAGARLLLPAR